LSDPYVLTERGVVNPRRVICYSSHERFTTKGVSRTMAGRALIIAEPDDITSVKLDFSSFLEVDERIEDAMVKGPATLLNYTYQSLIFTIANPTDSETQIVVSAKFTTGDRFTDRLYVRTPRRPHEVLTSSGPQTRGAL
jgi:hypothetical protein